jgi:hypothetical protein
MALALQARRDRKGLLGQPGPMEFKERRAFKAQLALKEGKGRRESKAPPARKESKDRRARKGRRDRQARISRAA